MHPLRYTGAERHFRGIDEPQQHPPESRSFSSALQDFSKATGSFSRTLRVSAVDNPIKSVISSYPQGSMQNRPCEVTSKPANGKARNVILSILLSPDQAIQFWFSSSAVRTSGCGRGVVGVRAWR
jgi:hypothetical protein